MVIGKMQLFFLPIIFKNIGYWQNYVCISANNSKNMVIFASRNNIG